VRRVAIPPDARRSGLREENVPRGASIRHDFSERRGCAGAVRVRIDRGPTLRRDVSLSFVQRPAAPAADQRRIGEPSRIGKKLSEFRLEFFDSTAVFGEIEAELP